MPLEVKATRSPMVTVGEPNSIGIPVSAIIADLGAVDHDGDTYEPGAFKYCGTQMISQWGHSALGMGAMPVGTGVITEKGGMAVFNGVLFKEMQAARDLAALLRRRGANQQWSYGYDVIDSRQDYREGKSIRVLKTVDAFEVSPVYKGAGVGTETLSLGETTWKLHSAHWWDGNNRCKQCDADYAVIEQARQHVMDLERSRR